MLTLFQIDIQSIQKVKEDAQLLFKKEEIEAGLDRMAEAITQRLSKSNPVVLCVLIGALIPAGNLLPRLNFPLELDYIHATRYTNETVGRPTVKWIMKPTIELKNRNVLIIEDILDGGLTLAAIIEYCQSQKAGNVYTAALLDKQKARSKGGIRSTDFVALQVDKGYVFGYGMDYKGYLRNTPDIYVVAPEHELAK